MEIVILFGGGDAGGIITRAWHQAIPPFGPEVLRELRAVNSLANRQTARSSGTSPPGSPPTPWPMVGRATGTTGASVMFRGRRRLRLLRATAYGRVQSPHGEA